MAEDSTVSMISTERQIERRVLAVVPSDPLQAYVEKGREGLLKDYYNPCSYFNKVYCLSPLEKTSGFKYGMHIIPTTAEQFATRIRELEVDIVRAYGGYWACDFACANKVEGIPVVVSVHDKRPSWLHNSICDADYVLTVSDVVKELVLSRKVPQEKMHYLPNSVNLNVFKPISDENLKEQFKAQYPGKYRILHVGRKSKEKNLDVVIRALSQLGTEYVCIFIGKSYNDTYHKLAQQYGVRQQCYFIESVPNYELARYYSFCDCMCTPSRSEGFGIVFIEALACEAVVVTSDIAPMNEYITNNISGILVKDFENPAAVSEAIVRACQEQSLRTYIRPNARKAAQPFNKETIEQLEMNLYKKFLHLSKSNRKIDVSQQRQVKSILGQVDRKTHYLNRLPVYRILAEADISDESTRKSPELAAQLKTAGMSNTNLENYWKRVNFIAQNCHGRVLELGCGCGNITRYISQNIMVTDVCAIDMQSEYIDQLRAYSFDKVEPICADALTYPFSGKFDCVVIAELIEHLTLSQEYRLISNLCGVLDPGSTLIITTPIGFMPDPDHVRGFATCMFHNHLEQYYGKILKRDDNSIQQFAVVAFESSLAKKLNPQVSIVLPTYNQLKFLPKAIESVLTQTYSNFELIIVNDGSTDGTREFLDSLKDSRIRIIHQENKRLPEALNTGFRAAQGELLTWISSDNYCEPAFLEKFVSTMNANPNAGLAYSDFARINEHDQIIEVTSCPDMNYSRLLLSFPGMASFMYRRICQDKVGFYDPALEGAEDWDMWLRIAEHFPITYIPETLYYYRQHTESLTTHKSALVSRSSQIVLENAFNRLRHQSSEISGLVALDVFLKAAKEFGLGNFVTATKYIRKYKLLRDYSKLPRTLNPTKENDNIALSVVIVTYNRNEDLKKCLQSLSNQAATDFNFEVIVVDNGQSHLDTFKQYMDQYIDCPINFNLAEGRNIGAHFARGDIIVFLDDDAVVGPDYISSIKSAFDRFDIFGLRGRTYPKTDTNAESNVNIYDLGDKPFPSYCNQEGNSAFLRQVYKAMGGMDPLLFGHEGSDLTYRIIQQYKLPDRVIYWPGAVIYHDFGTAEKFRQKKEIHRRNETYLKYKHDTNIFANRTDIEKYPLPLKQGSHSFPTPSFSDNNPSPISQTIHSNPKVSIVISCYNCEKFLPDCLDSIRNQTLHEWELLLLDDASTDCTRNIIEQYSRLDKRIKPYYFNDNKGPYVRRNFAIQQAHSDFIVIQDADDIMSPAKLELLYEEITKDDRLAVVGSFYRMFLDEFRGLTFTDKVELPITHDEIIERYASARYICWHGSAVIRKALFDAIGLYDENPYGSDKLWLAKAAEYACFTNQIKFKNIPEYLTLKREHPLSQQGLLPTLDPRSRRAKYQTYWEYKLSKIREKIHNNPATDIKTELKNCKCNDYIDRYSCLFEQWENQPLDDITLCRFISRAVKHFNEGKFVRCIIILDSIEKISADVTMRFKNYDLLRAIAYHAIDRPQQCRKYLSREIQTHNSAAAEKFITDYFENHSKTDIRKWCAENDKRYNLRMIDTEKESGDEQQSRNIPKWCISAWQDLQDDTNLSPPIAQVQSGPLVSVIIPAYNAAGYIKKAIESVLLQNYQNLELIVINDGSTDQTEDIVRTFEDERIKCFYQENSGLANAHNIGIKNSKGTFIIKLDADDMMAPDFIAAHLAEFEKSPHADLVYCDDCLIDEDEKLIRIIKRPDYSNRKLLIRDLFRCGFPVVPFRTCIKRSVFDKIGLFDESLLVGEDYDMMRRFVKHGLKIHHLPAALYLRRMTTESLSRQYSDEKAKAHFEVVRRFIDTFSCEELFPDVAWDKIAPQNRQLHVKCLAGVTCLTIARNYVETNSIVCANAAIDLARSQLTDALTAYPANQQVRQLLQKCESDRAACRQTRQHAVSCNK